MRDSSKPITGWRGQDGVYYTYLARDNIQHSVMSAQSPSLEIAYLVVFKVDPSVERKGTGEVTTGSLMYGFIPRLLFTTGETNQMEDPLIKFPFSVS